MVYYVNAANEDNHLLDAAKVYNLYNFNKFVQCTFNMAIIHPTDFDSIMVYLFIMIYYVRLSHK